MTGTTRNRKLLGTISSANTNTSLAASANPNKRPNNALHTSRPRPPPPIKSSHNIWFEGKNPRFIREVDPADYSKMFVHCGQPGCDKFNRRSVKRDGDGSNNYKSHYSTHHKEFTLTRSDERVEKVRQRAEASGFFTLSTQASYAQATAFTDTDNIQFRRLLVNWITINNLSLRVIESDATIQLFSFLNPAIKQISRRTLYRDIAAEFEASFDGKKAEIQRAIQVSRRVSLTTDCWSSRNNKEYMAVTAHYSDLDMRLQSTVLDIIMLPEATHDHEYLCQELLVITDRFKISSSIIAITRDNATVNDGLLRSFQAELEYRQSLIDDDLEAATKFLSFNTTDGDIRCISHVYNLAVQAGLEGLKAEAAQSRHEYQFEDNAIEIPDGAVDEVTRRAFFKMRSLVWAFLHKRYWRVGLQNQCKAGGTKYDSAQLDMPVRWNSTHKMMESFLKLQAPITAFLNIAAPTDPVKAKLALSPGEWSAIHEIKTFFLIFVQPSVRAQADTYPTLHRTIPQIIAIKRQLDGLRAITDRPQLKAACVAAFDKLDKYFREAMTTRACSVSTIIDPRYKLVFYQKILENEPPARRLTLLGKIEGHFQTVYNRYETRKSAIDRATREIEQDQHDNPLPANPRGPVIDLDDDVGWRDPMHDFIDDRPVTDIASEQVKYLREKCISVNSTPEDVRLFWLRKAIDYPILSQIAADFLAIPATSAPSERVFSIGSDILTRKRMRICPDLLRFAICLRSWGIWPEDDNFDE
jgi:hypothetical protein